MAGIRLRRRILEEQDVPEGLGSNAQKIAAIAS
jgi:hypothetical protein